MNRRTFCLSLATLPFLRPFDVNDVGSWQQIGDALNWEPIRYVSNPHIKTAGASAHHFYHRHTTGTHQERLAMTAEWHTLSAPTDTGRVGIA